MGGKRLSNRISTTLPRTEVTAPRLVVFFMFAFADPHLRHPSRHCIRHGAPPSSPRFVEFGNNRNQRTRSANLLLPGCDVSRRAATQLQGLSEIPQGIFRSEEPLGGKESR